MSGWEKAWGESDWKGVDMGLPVLDVVFSMRHGAQILGMGRKL